jgi:hypothetical protein
LAITTALTLPAVFRLALRQTSIGGGAQSRINPLGHDDALGDFPATV